ncbi:hypothetical protein MTO96_015165 [Rhipicephalus appendiculatus]
MPKVSKLTLGLLSVPFMCSRHLIKHATRTMLPAMRFFAAKTFALISANNSSLLIKVFTAMVALRGLYKSDSGECGLAVAFASLLWAVCPVVSALSCIARNRFYTAQPPLRNFSRRAMENAAQEADTMTESNVPRLRQKRDLQPSVGGFSY